MKGFSRIDKFREDLMSSGFVAKQEPDERLFEDVCF